MILSLYLFPEQMPPGMPSAAQARTIQGIPSGASDQEKVSLTLTTYDSIWLDIGLA